MSETPSNSVAPTPAASSSPRSTPRRSGRRHQKIRLDHVDPGPADDRRSSLDPERLRSLADSLNRHGLLEPILVAPAGERYTTLAGRCRREAARLNNWTMIEAIVIDVDDRAGWGISIAENLHRTELSPYEEAAACAQAIQDLGYTVDQIAAAMQRSANWVQGRLDMLTWDDEILQAIHEKKISVAAGAPLARIADEAVRRSLVAEAIRFGATARTASAWAQAAQCAASAGQLPAPISSDGSPSSNPPIPHQNCWACGTEHPCTALSHLPTCSTCYESLPAAIAASLTNNT